VCIDIVLYFQLLLNENEFILFELLRQTINRYNFFVSLKYWGKLIRLFDIITIISNNYAIVHLF